MNKPNRTVNLLLAAVATLIVAILISIGSAGNGKSDTDGLGTVDNAAFNSTPSNPLNADAADTATTPKVRGGGPIRSWADLDARYGNDSSYKQCAEKTLDISWDDDVPRIKQIEKKRTDGVSFILAVNVDTAKFKDDAAIVEFARKHERPRLRKDTPVVRVDYFINTMDNSCTEFVDKRSLIRVAQAVPTNQVDEPLRTDKVMGIFDGCKNPFELPEGVKPSGSPAPSLSDSKSPSPSPSGSTPGPSETPTPSSKNPSEDPANNGNAGDGSGRNEDSGPGESIPPKDMESPPDKPRENPATPTPNKPAPPKVTPTTGGNQTVAPSQQPVNDGNVDPNPESGQPCNPEFQNC